MFVILKATGKFNFKETTPIDKDIELMLYDEKMRDINNLHNSIERGNFNVLFEDGSFDFRDAQSIATAKVGQIVSPTITSAIGKQHGADYLIQGTIINLGRGNNTPLNGNVSIKESAIRIEISIRIIKAENGEVVWSKEVDAQKKSSSTKIGIVKIGTEKLSSSMYSEIMEKASQRIVDAIISDQNAMGLLGK